MEGEKINHSGSISVTLAVAMNYGINTMDLKKRTRARRISEPRMLAIALLIATREKKGTQLGIDYDLTSGTISHAKKSVRTLCRYNSCFRAKVNEVLALLYDDQGARERVMENLLNVRPR